MSSAALDTQVGRPRKFQGEDTETVSLRVPKASVGDYLRLRNPSTGVATWDILTFERMLTERLAGELKEIRIWAAREGLSYDLHRAEVIARLIHIGLHCPSKK